jgi:hypothetical protein
MVLSVPVNGWVNRRAIFYNHKDKPQCFHRGSNPCSSISSSYDVVLSTRLHFPPISKIICLKTTTQIKKKYCQLNNSPIIFRLYTDYNKRKYHICNKLKIGWHDMSIYDSSIIIKIPYHVTNQVWSDMTKPPL